MLSGETAAGDFPVKAVEMMVRIALEVEEKITFKAYPSEGHLDIMALAEASNIITCIVNANVIAVLTTSGRSARYVAAERPKAQILAITTDSKVYHGLNLIWGITPVLTGQTETTFEGLATLAREITLEKKKGVPGDKLVILGGVPGGIPGGTNFIKIETL